MFESLTKGFDSVFNGVLGKKKIKKSNIDEALKEIKGILIDSDVNLDCINTFLENVKKDALGEEVIKSVSAREKFIKIVNDNLIDLLGKESRELNVKPSGQTIILMAGLQGSGKTTATAKIANLYKDKKKTLLIGADVYRPAAKEQLQILADKAGVDCFVEKHDKAEKTVKNGLKYAKKNNHELVIIDTAGRLQIDKELMEELKRIEKIAKPTEVLLVVDSMTGQVAAEVAKEFKDTVDITGVVLSKFDSDTKGGAALSVKMISEVPILFASVGETINDIETFYPDRLAQRMLGMGDIVSLVEKAEKQFDEEKAKKLAKKMKKNQFDFDDMYDQLKAMNKMGSLESIAQMIPGAGGIDKSKLSSEEKKFQKFCVIIQSMTKKERVRPILLNNPSRKKRIAKGSGTKIFDIQQLLSSYKKMKKTMKKMNSKKFQNMMAQYGGEMPDMGDLSKFL